jgi:hypothetical protein
MTPESGNRFSVEAVLFAVKMPGGGAIPTTAAGKSLNE